ncbi:MAG: hypothetical protein ACOC2U_03140 [bacterium]
MKDLKKFISTKIRQYLNEQQILKENLDLSDRDNVVAWLDKNAPESIFDDDGNIDWEQGFYSFLAYGESEFECYMKKGSRCLITHINKKELKYPIEAVC